MTAGTAVANTYEVGAGKPYPTFAALPALLPGDVVLVHPGVYNEVVRWTASGLPEAPIVIRGVGASRPIVDGSGRNLHGVLPQPRAVFQIEGSHYIIENVEIRNGRNTSANGAGIRIVGARDVVVRNSRITASDMGVMGNDYDELVFETTEIAYNGLPSPYTLAHNVYLAEGGSARFSFCYIHDALSGQNFKSRGHYTELLYNYIADSNEGEVVLVDSASTTIPESHALVLGNVIVSKANRTGNAVRFIYFGQDVGGSRTGTLYLVNNTLVAGSTWIEFVEATSAGSRIEASNNIFAGSSRLVRPSAAGYAGAHNWVRSGTTIPAEFFGTIVGSDPGFVDGNARDFRLSPGSSAREIGASTVFYKDGSGASLFAVPEFEYVNHLASRPRANDAARDAGAYEHGVAANRPPQAVVVVTPSTGVAPLSVNFDGRGSWDPEGVIASYVWDFGDGSGATSATASHTYMSSAAFAARLTVTDTAGAAHSVTQLISVTAPSGPDRFNVAPASAGAIASASSSYSAGYTASGAIDGDRRGRNWGSGSGWNDGTSNNFPDWLAVDFAGPRTIDEIAVFTVQDNYTSPLEPTASMAFSLYGLRDFALQYWDGVQWLTVPGGAISGNTSIWRRVTFPAVTTSRIRVLITRTTDIWSRVTEIEAYGTAAAPGGGEEPGGGIPGVNVAAAAAGAVATSSSSYNSSYAPSGAIDGARSGREWGNGGGWNDSTWGGFPDWLAVDFAGPRTINEVAVFTVQDNYTAPAEPNASMTFSLYGLRDFAVQYWDGGQWLTVPGGNVTDNTQIWRRVAFPAITTSRIRILVTRAADGFSRIAEVEAYGAAGTSPPPPGGPVNVASASAGSVAMVSSAYSAAYSPAGAIDGERAGRDWGSNGGWNDSSWGAFPDWLVVDFAGPRTINEVAVFSVQDNYTAPSEPNVGMTFSLYGLRNFEVQYWDGAQWLTVPGGNITGNIQIWRRVAFPAVTTTRIRILVTGAADGYSRIAEVEAFQVP